MVDINSNNLGEIRAEVLLNYLYPEAEWNVEGMGSFYRNYNRDILSLDEVNKRVALARDGFIRILPQGLITDEDELKKGEFKESYSALRRRRSIIEDLFRPVDCLTFSHLLHIERYVSRAVINKMAFILKTYFFLDVSQCDCYVRSLAWLLPKINVLRGNFNFIKRVFSTFFDCPVTCEFDRYSSDDTTLQSIPWVKYKLYFTGLSSQSYMEKLSEIRPLCSFIKEWFIPYDVKCDIEIKSREKVSRADTSSVLNYNVVIE